MHLQKVQNSSRVASSHVACESSFHSNRVPTQPRPAGIGRGVTGVALALRVAAQVAELPPPFLETAALTDGY